MGEVTYAKQTPEQAKILQLTKDIEDIRSAHSLCVKENKIIAESNKQLTETAEDLRLELAAAKQYVDQLVKEKENSERIQKDYDDLYAAFKGLSTAFKMF